MGGRSTVSSSLIATTLSSSLLLSAAVSPIGAFPDTLKEVDGGEPEEVDAVGTGADGDTPIAVALVVEAVLLG